MFTGDRSGDWLYRALHHTGFAVAARERLARRRPAAHRRLHHRRRRAAPRRTTSRCPEEIRNCRPYLERELDMLKDVRVVVALGKIAFDNYLAVLRARGAIAPRAGFVFGHDREFVTCPGQPALIASYHPSQQNTSTGRLTEAMLLDVFRQGEGDRGWVYVRDLSSLSE